MCADCSTGSQIGLAGDEMTGGKVNHYLAASAFAIGVGALAVLSGSCARAEHFTLLRGKGQAVCEAYRLRLERTKFELPSYCDRPESSAVEGFRSFMRIPLTRQQDIRLWQEVWPLVQERSLLDARDDQERARNVSADVDIRGLDMAIPSASYGFEADLDIENNGSPRTTVIYRMENPKLPVCGIPRGPRPVPTRIVSMLVVLAPSGDIDYETTRRFEGRVAARKSSTGLMEKVLWPLGMSFGLFEYMGTVYYDTYDDFDAPFVWETDPRTRVLRVYGMTKGHRVLHCELVQDPSH